MVDVGIVIMIDVLNSEGEYFGGWILFGFDLMIILLM